MFYVCCMYNFLQIKAGFLALLVCDMLLPCYSWLYFRSIELDLVTVGNFVFIFVSSLITQLIMSVPTLAHMWQFPGENLSRIFKDP